MPHAARRRLTEQDLLDATLPDGPMPELIDGELDYKPSPRARHSYGQGQVRGALEPVVRHGGGDDPPAWWILIEPDTWVDDHTIVRPDLAGWRRERMPELPDGAIRVAPDWICEVLSPGHEGRDRIHKMEIYGRLGVAWYWLLGPETRTLEVFALRDGSWMFHGGWEDGDRARIPPFEGVEIEIARLLAPRPSPPIAREPSARYG